MQNTNNSIYYEDRSRLYHNLAPEGSRFNWTNETRRQYLEIAIARLGSNVVDVRPEYHLNGIISVRAVYTHQGRG